MLTHPQATGLGAVVPDDAPAERREPGEVAPTTPGLDARVDWAKILVPLALLVGVLLRLLQYVLNRSLWLDEALLAPQITERSFAQILDPGAWSVTPPGFLLIEKVFVTALGANEYTLRLLPLLAGIGSLYVFLAVARRLLSPRAVPVAVWIFALAPFLIYYSSELKQYSSDVLVSLLLLWGATELRARGVSRNIGLLWGGVGLLAIFVSQTAVFVLGGLTLALLLGFAWDRDRTSVGWLLAPGAAWALLFGTAYIVVLRGVDTSGYMQTFWSSGFMPLPPRSLADLAWFPETFQRVFRDPLGVIGDRQIENNFYQAAAGMFAFGAGCLWMWSHRRGTLGLLALPIALTLLASGLRIYPFGGDWISGGRVILFLAPSFFLLIGEGAHQLTRRMRGLGLAVTVLLIAPGAAYALIAVPNGRVEVRPLLEHAVEHWRPGDVLYAHYELKPALRYYAPRLGIPAQAYIEGVCARFEPNRYLDDLSQVRRYRRAWVVFGTGIGARNFDEKGLMLDFLDHLGTPASEIVAQGASLHLIELDPGALPSYSRSIPAPEYSPTEDCRLWN